ncbi:hypothetical protein GXW74_11445 [Roseomonas eburnea]|uniref:Uncharacterized protein n=1 Tax=Neoroseomonas eburnea TaxID=1346889 RepID=A0A9X9XBL8_9PROT|nr:hypothetical protein [Neoroseomonas eburnea]MBR0681104.1 hypothetical protein [Neoroseomonas eburnea]
MAQADLEAMHEEALSLLRAPGAHAPCAPRHAVSVVLLQQLMVARKVVDALRVAPAEAQAAMRSDHALGYFFGLASGGNDLAAASPAERRVGSALLMVHSLVFGRQAAERLTADLDSGAVTVVGEAFGEGLLAAATDLAEFRRWLRGDGGALPGGLLDGLPWPGLARENPGGSRH